MDIAVIAAFGLGGVGWSLVGFLKGWSRRREDFDLKKFGKTILYGLLIGIAAGYSGVEYEAVSPELVGFATIGSQKVIDILWAAYKGPSKITK